MTLILLPAAIIDAIHDEVLNPGELQGRALDKSLEGALARVDNRLAYGMIADAYDLAAAYAIAISQGHCFNDGNKRTAYRAMQTCLDLNGLPFPTNEAEIGPVIIRAAQRLLDEGELAHWLRRHV
ncbi:MAG: type II toxin-antitoxin system death-on-curing family toxin [Rhodobacteraceae bacterium]|nr:type II toxin-antitoxin system death-on-curing family toxin [Paracoccaceae bacterium]